MTRYVPTSVSGISVAVIRNCGVAVLVAAGLGTSTLAQAAPQTLSARQRASQSSTFTLDFGDFGGERQANITTTEFELEVDADAGTARFVSYHQDVDPLTLPGDISTGDITVEIVPGSSAGTFDPANGRFSTTELYAVYFEGDLSAYGLESPVYLPSDSEGAVTFRGPRFGSINLDWAGRGELNNPFDPQTPIVFNYTCDVAAAFGLRQLSPDSPVPANEQERAGATDEPSVTDIDAETEAAPAVERRPRRARRAARTDEAAEE